MSVYSTSVSWCFQAHYCNCATPDFVKDPILDFQGSLIDWALQISVDQGIHSLKLSAHHMRELFLGSQLDKISLELSQSSEQIQVLVKLAAQLSAVLSESPEGVASTWSVACAARTSGGRHGFTALLGPVKCQLAITLLSLLPWIITHCLDTRPPLNVISTSEAGYHHRSESSGSSKCAEETHRTLQSAIAALAGCCISQKLEALASALLGLVIGCTGGSGAEWEASLELSLRRLAAPLVAAFFPKCASISHIPQ